MPNESNFYIHITRESSQHESQHTVKLFLRGKAHRESQAQKMSSNERALTGRRVSPPEEKGWEPGRLITGLLPNKNARSRRKRLGGQDSGRRRDGPQGPRDPGAGS